MQIGEPELVQRLDGVAVERHRIGLAATIGDAVGRQPDADAVGAPNLGHRLRHLQQEADAVLDRAAILIGPHIALRLQELLDQIAVGAVDLDAVEAGGERVLRALPVSLDHQRDLGGLQRPRRLVLDHLAVRRHALELGGDRNRRRRHRQRTVRLERGVRDAADVPELQEDQAALGVHRIDHLAPARDLGLAVDAGDAGIAEAGGDHRRGFRDQQAAFCRALRVIFRVHRPRRQTRPRRPHPRQRRHHDTVLQLVGTDLER